MANEVNIPLEDGIPLPPMSKYTGIYIPVMEKMEVGQSFVVTASEQKTVRDVAYRLKKRTGKQYTQRKLDSGLYRMWRIK